LGASGSLVEVDVDVEVADESEVVLLSSLVVLVLDSALLVELSVSDDVSSLVPIVVGLARLVASAVSCTATLLRSMGSRPEAVATTVAAMFEDEPHPYWKYPPAKVF
jgi:hypothetical protein